MQLKDINHSRYRARLKIVFASAAISLIIFSLSLSTLFISLLSTPDADHFYHNLGGLAAAVFIVIVILNKIRHIPYMLEVIYVWNLKQQLNKIYRKQRKIEIAVENNDVTAMTIMLFSYKGSKQLYQLDENIITMDSLLSQLMLLEKRIQNANLNLSEESYHQAMLEQF